MFIGRYVVDEYKAHFMLDFESKVEILFDMLMNFLIIINNLLCDHGDTELSYLCYYFIQHPLLLPEMQ